MGQLKDPERYYLFREEVLVQTGSLISDTRKHGAQLTDVLLFQMANKWFIYTWGYWKNHDYWVPKESDLSLEDLQHYRTLLLIQTSPYAISPVQNNNPSV